MKRPQPLARTDNGAHSSGSSPQGARLNGRLIRVKHTTQARNEENNVCCCCCCVSSSCCCCCCRSSTSLGKQMNKLNEQQGTRVWPGETERRESQTQTGGRLGCWRRKVTFASRVLCACIGQGIMTRTSHDAAADDDNKATFGANDGGAKLTSYTPGIVESPVRPLGWSIRLGARHATRTSGRLLEVVVVVVDVVVVLGRPTRTQAGPSNWLGPIWAAVWRQTGHMDIAISIGLRGPTRLRCCCRCCYSWSYYYYYYWSHQRDRFASACKWPSPFLTQERVGLIKRD